MPPVWLVPRTATPAQANLLLTEVVLHLAGLPAVANDSVRPPAANTKERSGYVVQYRVPVAVNSGKIRAGAEWKLLSPALPTREATAAKKSTWLEDAKGKTGKQAKAEANK